MSSLTHQDVLSLLDRLPDTRLDLFFKPEAAIRRALLAFLAIQPQGCGRSVLLVHCLEDTF